MVTPRLKRSLNLDCPKESSLVEALTLGPFVLPLSRLYVLVAIIAMFVSARWWERRRGLDLGPALWMALLIGVIVARLVYVLVHWSSFRAEPLSAVYLWQDGYVPLAGIAAGLVAAGAIAYRRRYPQRVLQGPVLIGAAVWLGLSTVTGALSAQQDLPAIVLQDLTEQPAPLEAYRGAPVVVNLWATWCPPCRREMPVFQAAQQNNPDIQFVFVNQREPAPTISEYLQSEQLTLANVLRDPFGAVSSHFGAVGMPTTLFFDAEGRLVDSHVGEVSRARLDQYLRALRD
jgi:thiol-disulfide isomerase/thioredoxin